MTALARKIRTPADVTRRVDADAIEAAPWAEEIPVTRYIAALKVCAGVVKPLAFVHVGDTFETYGDASEELASELLLSVSHCLCQGERVAVVRVPATIIDAVALAARKSGRTVIVLSNFMRESGESSLVVTRFDRPSVSELDRETEVTEIVESLPRWLRIVCQDILRLPKSDRMFAANMAHRFLTRCRRAGEIDERLWIEIAEAMRKVPARSRFAIPGFIRRFGELAEKIPDETSDHCDNLDDGDEPTGLRLIRSDATECLGTVRPGA